MLKQRVLTAVILGPLAIWGILALPTMLFSGMLGLVIAIAAWEWAGLAHLEGRGARGGYTLAVLSLLAVLYDPMIRPGPVPIAVLAAALVWWFAAFVWVLFYPGGSGIWRRGPVLPGIAGVLALVPAWAALTALHGVGPRFVLMLVLLVWAADIGAFFAGRRWGRRKLAPRVSPGKTWEGLGGALLAAGVLAWAGTGLIGLPPGAAGSAFFAVCIAAVAVSALGDLVESMFKRLADVKDSSHILPGHGGVLDRIDSITAAAPLFTAGLMAVGIGL